MHQPNRDGELSPIWWRFGVTAPMIYLYVKTEITETTRDNEVLLNPNITRGKRKQMQQK